VRYQKTSFDELLEVVWALLHYVDLLPNSSSRLTQSERLFGQLQIVCCKRHQLFGHSRPGTCLGESNAPFGQLPTAGDRTLKVVLLLRTAGMVVLLFEITT
jgi:hypothetical protein